MKQLEFVLFYTSTIVMKQERCIHQSIYKCITLSLRDGYLWYRIQSRTCTATKEHVSIHPLFKHLQRG